MNSLQNLFRQSATLRTHIDEVIRKEKPRRTVDAKAVEALPTEYSEINDLATLEMDLMVTHVEVNNLHGTGILIKRMFPDWREIMHVWTHSAYSINDFGIVQMFIGGWKLTRNQMFAKATAALKDYTLRSVMCVPFCPEDLITALCAKHSRNVPLLIYVMDDQNLTHSRIPDNVLREAFDAAAIVFAISPEMRDAYEAKFGIKCYLLPPLVRADDLMLEPVAGERVEFKDTGILLGNIWNAKWLEEIRHVVRDSGKTIHWYGNAGKAVEFDPAGLERDGIIFKGALPETEICAEIRKYAYGVLPSSPDGQEEDWLAKYSIPTRLVTSVAAGNLPMVVMGSEASASSQFVKKFGVGRICPYDSAKFREAVDAIVSEEAQAEIRVKSAGAAKLFSDVGIADWLRESLRRGEPVDRRFEEAFGAGVEV